MNLPILYSFRRCPYAMRARMALILASKDCELRAIALKNKPDEMLQISAKGTVPVLELPNKVLEESLDIISWAMESCPESVYIFSAKEKLMSESLIELFDSKFKYHLDRYKYSSRYEPQDKIMHRDLAMLWIEKLEIKLSKSAHLSGSDIGIFDYISLPFVRQFRIADPEWFDSCNLPNLHKRLSEFLESKLFMQTMKKMPIWKKTGQDIVF